MKKICFAFNHFQFSDGVARSAIAIANYLCAEKNIEITLRPIFIMNKETLSFVDERVHIKPLFRFYFPGFSSIISKIPDKLLHNIVFGNNKYDIEIGFQHGIATKAVASYTNNKNIHIIWIHGFDESLSLKKYYQKASLVVCVSKYNSEKLKKELDYYSSIDYCYNPIDEKDVIKSGKEEINLSNNSNIRFISVGRHSQEKGYIRLIEAVKKLKDEKYKFELILVGDGPQHAEIKSMIENYQLNDFVKLVGQQKNPHKYTSKSDVFICSSYSEGYSTACTEAIMLGIPVLTTKVSGALEIIDDAECGIVVENNTDGLYNGMKKILDNPNIISNWKKTLNKTKKRFFLNSRIKKLKQILNI